MGSGSPVSQGAPVPQSAPAPSAPTPDTTFDAFNPPAPAPAPAPSEPVFDAFTPPPSAFTGSDPALLQQFNLPSGSFIPGNSPIADLRRRREAGLPGINGKIVRLENLSFQERLARANAGLGPLFNRVALVPLPPEQDELDAGISGAGSSSPPAPPSPPTGQDELDARPPNNEEPIISPAPRRLDPSGEGFSLPSPFGGTAETVGGIASIADTALGLGLPGLGPAANLAVQAGQFLNLPESQRGSIDAGEAVSSLLPFGLGGDNIETQFANLTSQDELNAGESIPNIPTGQDELDAGIVDDFSDFKNFQGFEGRSDGLIGFGFQDFGGSLPFNPRTVAPGSREEAFLQTINPDFRATGSGAQPASPFEIVPPPGTDPRFIGPDDPVFDAFDPPAPDTTFDAFTPPPPALSRNPEEAERQVRAANITQAVEAQNPGSLGRERVRSASQVLRENFDRKRGDTAFDSFNPSSLGSGVRVAGLGDVLADVGSSVVNFLTPENRLDRSRREAEARRRLSARGVPGPGQERAEKAAALTNPASGGVPAQGAVPGVQVGGEGRQGKLLPSPEQVIKALGAPDGKGGIKPEADRGILDRLLSNFSPTRGTPSATVPLNIPADPVAERRAELAEQRRQFERQQAAGGFGASNTGQLPAGNQGNSRGVIDAIFRLLGIGGAAGGLVGLMRKGN